MNYLDSEIDKEIYKVSKWFKFHIPEDITHLPLNIEDTNHLIYSGQDIFVTYRNFDGDRVWINFPGKGIFIASERESYKVRASRDYFIKRKIDCIDILLNKVDWYQNPEMKAACEAINKVTQKYKRRISYGSSMGGHGALLFSKLLKIDIVLSFSPRNRVNQDVLTMDEGLTITGKVYIIYGILNKIDENYMEGIKRIIRKNRKTELFYDYPLMSDSHVIISEFNYRKNLDVIIQLIHNEENEELDKIMQKIQHTYEQNNKILNRTINDLNRLKKNKISI